MNELILAAKNLLWDYFKLLHIVRQILLLSFSEIIIDISDALIKQIINSILMKKIVVII